MVRSENQEVATLQNWPGLDCMQPTLENRSVCVKKKMQESPNFCLSFIKVNFIFLFTDASLFEKHNTELKIPRVSIRKTFAQFLRNETLNFCFFAHQFCAKKKQQFAQSFAKVISRKIALFRNSAISYQNPKRIVQ